MVFSGLGTGSYALVPLIGHWPEIVTWPQPTCKGGWEMWGALGYLLSIKHQCHTDEGHRQGNNNFYAMC